MAEEAKTNEVKNIDIDMEKLTAKGKIHAEQFQNLKMQKVQHQVEIEKIDVLLSYYTQTIQQDAAKFAEDNKDSDTKTHSEEMQDSIEPITHKKEDKKVH